MHRHLDSLSGPLSPLPRLARHGLRWLGAALTSAALLVAAPASAEAPKHRGGDAAQASKAKDGAKHKQKPATKRGQKPKPAKSKAKGKGEGGKGEGKKSGAAKKGAKATAAPSGDGKAPQAAAPTTAPVKLELAVQRLVLDNGLRLVLNVDKTSPTVAVAVTYDVGSRNETRGRSGFAHLFEHMMFQGSANAPKGEHFKLVSGHGGVLNGTTSTDRTNYFEVLPANELPLALWLEADRMKSLDISAENFENQRRVVQEEYRMRVSNAAYAPSSIRLEELVFQGYWPYEHDTIGSMADLDAAELPWVKEFFARHYAPNNAVLTIAGDFDAEGAIAAVHKYFDSVPRAEVTPFDAPTLPEQTSQRTAVLKDPNARTPGILYGWAVPAARTPDHYALEVAALILGGGESSRLHQLLVRDKAVAQRVSAGTEDRRGPDLLSIDTVLSEGAKVGDVEKLVEGEIKALGTQGPSDAELTKAHRRAQASLVLGLQSNMSRATRLGEYEAFFGDARLLNEELPKYLAVTKDDVKRVVAQHLGPTRRTIVETYPPDAPADAPAKGLAPPKGEPKPGEPRHDDATHAKKTDAKKTGGKSADASASKKKAAPAAGGKPKKQKKP